MSSLNFNGGNTSTRKIPAVSGGHGKVLYALCRYGRQTARELVLLTGYCGAQERANELLNKYYLPIIKGSRLVKMETGREVYVTTYGLDRDFINSSVLRDFKVRARRHYGDLD
jgi:hypothetical protein